MRGPARSNLFGLLEFCRSCFDRVVVFTSLPEARFRAVAEGLVNRGEAPAWFAAVKYVPWHGAHKRLEFVAGCELHEVLLVDDMEVCVLVEQRNQWIAVRPFEPPYDGSDGELERVVPVLAEELRRRESQPPGV